MQMIGSAGEEGGMLDLPAAPGKHPQLRWQLGLGLSRVEGKGSEWQARCGR